MTPPIEAVLFDWDLTLARVLGDVTESERLAALFRSQGLDFTPGEIEAAVRPLQDRVGKDGLSRSWKPQRRRDIINSYFQILSHLGVAKRDLAFGNRLYDAHGYLPTFLYDKSLPTLRLLQQKQLNLGIISNHAHSVRAIIERTVGQFIPARQIIISQEVGVHKPTKTIFLRAARRVGVPPARCMFVGDNLTVDAIGAVQQGGFGRGLWLDRAGNGVDLALPDRVFRIASLDQVLAFI